MRGLFDQYRHPENRLTHALCCCLDEDPRLAKSFLRWIAPDLLRGRKRIKVLEQQVPGRVAPDDEDEETGLPDGWLYDPDDDWALIIESKITASVGSSQLKRHVSTAERAGFQKIRLLLITTEESRQARDHRSIRKTWSDLYEWFGRFAKESLWAWRFVDYLRAAEVRLVSEGYLMAGTLTRFDGFHFTEERPYTAREGRRLIRLIREELVRRKDLRLIIDQHRPGRPAITGRGTSGVWDFLWLRAAKRATYFTEFPHLTFALHADHIEVALTLPNGLGSDLRRKLVTMPREQFHKIVEQVCRKMKRIIKIAPGATPRMRINQRHFLSQNSKARTDAELDFDLRTAFIVRGGRVKHQPQWLDAVFDVIRHRRANIQLQIWLRIPYADGITDRRAILDQIADGWQCCMPLVESLGL